MIVFLLFGSVLVLKNQWTRVKSSFNWLEHYNFEMFFFSSSNLLRLKNKKLNVCFFLYVEKALITPPSMLKRRETEQAHNSNARHVTSPSGCDINLTHLSSKEGYLSCQGPALPFPLLACCLRAQTEWRSHYTPLQEAIVSVCLC